MSAADWNGNWSGFLQMVPVFADRLDAGVKLGMALRRFQDWDPLVLGIPRGGVPVAAEVARCLDAELDVVVSRKLCLPGHPERTLGAVTGDGVRWLDERMLSEWEVRDQHLKAMLFSQMREAQQRWERCRDGRPEPVVEGRVVLLVDDGLATGATMRAAVRSLRRRRPSSLVVAVPVGPREACEDLRKEADEVICLHQPAEFHAVRQFYRSLRQTTDDEVQRLLRGIRGQRGAAVAAQQGCA